MSDESSHTEREGLEAWYREVHADLDAWARGTNVAPAAPAVQRPPPSEARGVAGLALGTGLLAAGLASLLMIRSGDAPAPPLPVGHAALAVEAARPFVVYQPENPDLTIVWLLDEPEETP